MTRRPVPGERLVNGIRTLPVRTLSGAGPSERACGSRQVAFHGDDARVLTAPADVAQQHLAL
ncbi:MAG: hypothetical protein ABI187_08015, partial [Ornithinibacter sp.]